MALPNLRAQKEPTKDESNRCLFNLPPAAEEDVNLRSMEINCVVSIPDEAVHVRLSSITLLLTIPPIQRSSHVDLSPSGGPLVPAPPVPMFPLVRPKICQMGHPAQLYKTS